MIMQHINRLVINWTINIQFRTGLVGIFLFTTMSRMVMGQWVLGSLSLGIKCVKHEHEWSVSHYGCLTLLSYPNWKGNNS